MLRHFSILLLLCVSAFGQITNINFGTTPDDRTGDNLRKAGSKMNTNTAWLASQLGAATNASTTFSNLWRVSQSPVVPNLSTNWFQVATWGDSLTAGSGASPSSNAYPSVLALQSGYTVSNGGVGGETSTQIKTRMLADTASHVNPTIIWAGRNNYSTPSTVVTDVAAMVSALAAAGNTNRFLVLSVLNGSYGSYEAPGGEGYAYITNINTQLSAAYGSNFVDIRAFLVSLYNSGDATDVADNAADRPPTSLRSDAIHLNNAGYSAVANYLLTNKVAILRGTWSPYTTAKALQVALASPPPIGITTPNTSSWSDLYSIYLRVGGVANFKTFSLSGDYSSVQLNGNFIPLSHNGNDVGYNSALAWRNGYFAGTVYSTNFAAYASLSSPFASLSETVTPLLRIGVVNTNSTITRAADGSLQFGSSLIFGPDSTYSIGTDTIQNRPLHGYFAGNLYADVHYGNSATITNITSTGTLTLTNSGNSARIMSDTDYRGYKYNDNAGAGYGAGATADLLTIGSYAKTMSGILTVRTWSASSRGLYTYVLGIMGGGDAATITPTSFQQYGATALTGTLTLVKDTPSGGTDTVRFTVGPNALTAIEFAWKPMLVDGSSTITGF